MLPWLGGGEIDNDHRKSCRGEYGPKQPIPLQHRWKAVGRWSNRQRRRRGCDLHRHDERLIAPKHLDLSGFGERCIAQQTVQIFHLAHRLPIEFENDISAFEATLLGGTMAHEAEDDHAFTQLSAPLGGAWDILDKHPKMTAALGSYRDWPEEHQTLDDNHHQYRQGASWRLRLRTHEVVSGIH